MFHTLIDPVFLARDGGGTPVLDLNFAATKALDSRITFVRGSNATYVDSSGLIQTASSNVARFTHNTVTLRSLGLLIEESRTNLITYSEAINNAAWTHVGGSHTANQTTAPSGEVTADLFTENSAASTQHRLYQIPVVATGTTYTASVFVKRASGSRQFALTLTTTTSVARVYFNLDTGTVGTVVAGSGTITAYPNDWYRCTATGVSDGLLGTVFLQLCNGTTSGSETYTGDGTSGLYIWGAQLEAGAFPTSYITTAGATATRAADLPSITGSNFTSWFNANKGTFRAEVLLVGRTLTGLTSVPRIVGGNSAAAFLALSAPSGTVFTQDTSGNANTVSGLGSVNAITAAMKYSSGVSTVAGNGLIGNSATFLSTAITSLTLGNDNGATQFLNGTIGRITYYSHAFNQTQLLALSQ
jgi:hypothetical protein